MADIAYTCRYCRQPSDASGVACPNCGAPIDVRGVTSESGWEKQPPIVDMARIQFGQSKLQITGTQVPVADFDLAANDWIYFHHHSLLWADPATRLQTMSMRGAWKRMLGGLPVFMVQAVGPGRLAVSDDHPGEVIALPLLAGQQVWVREHRFLAATGSVGYDWESADVWYTTGSGNDRKTHYPLGTIGDRFGVSEGRGLLLLHAPGNVFVRDLGPGESLLIQPSSLLYRDLSVTGYLHLEYPRTSGLTSLFSLFSNSFSYRTVWLRLTGPGRVAVQSVFSHPEESEAITSSSGSTSARW